MLHFSILFIGILFLFIPPLANADFIDYIGIRVDRQDILTVCFFEPQDQKLKDMEDHFIMPAILGVSHWKDKLAEYSGDDKFDIQLKFVSNSTHFDKSISSFKECDVMYTFWDSIGSQTDDMGLKKNGLAWTSYDHSRSYHKYSVIAMFPILENFDRSVQVENGTIYTAEDIRKLGIDMYLSQDIVFNISIHEFGHALGLGHLCYDAMGFEMESVMAPALDPYSTDVFELSVFDLAAVYSLYNGDGWKTWSDNINQWYGIPSESVSESQLLRCAGR